MRGNISGNAASQSRFEATVALSYPVLGISLGEASAFIVIIGLVVARVRRKG